MSNDKDYIMTLSNNKKYALVNLIMYHEKTYVYLAELEDYTKYIIGEIVDDEVVVVEDQELLGQLIAEFANYV